MGVPARGPALTLRVRLAQLLVLIDEWLSWPECACGRRHDPRDHYGLHDERYDT